MCVELRIADDADVIMQIKFIAALERGNVVATQFHPELSGSYGTELIQYASGIASAPFCSRPLTVSTRRRWLATGPATSTTIETTLGHLPKLSGITMRRVIPCLDVKNGRVVKGA